MPLLNQKALLSKTSVDKVHSARPWGNLWQFFILEGMKGGGAALSPGGIYKGSVPPSFPQYLNELCYNVQCTGVNLDVNSA